jgi:hypothetical protein
MVASSDGWNQTRAQPAPNQENAHVHMQRAALGLAHEVAL